MIEYTINPQTYEPSSGHLMVEVVPVDSTLGLSTQTLVVPISPDFLHEVLLETEVDAQKALLRKHIIRFNTSIQSTWDTEVTANTVTIPSSLTDLLGVAGTTAVTADEITVLESFSVDTGPIII